MKKIICLSFLLISLIPFYPVFANDTDLYILTQIMQQVPPDALLILDLSGSMNNTPAGTTLYASSSSYCDSGPAYPSSGTGHTHACTYQEVPGSQAGPVYGDSTCNGPYYGSSGTGHTTNCSKLAIAKRGIFSFLDVDDGSAQGHPDGIINASDQSYLNIRMGYMRFYNCGSPETVNSTSYTSGCNTLIWPNPNSSFQNSTYSQIYNSISGEQQASMYTPLAASLQEALYYLNYTKSNDTYAACRQKFVILITDGNDTCGCSSSCSENATNEYKKRRETVAQARALANAGYLVFVVGFGANQPHYQKNTLNWAAYYGGTNNPGATDTGMTSMYPIPTGKLYPSGLPANGTNNTQQCATSTTCSHDLGDGSHYYACISSQNTTQFLDPGEAGLSGYAFIAANAQDLQNAVAAIRNYIIQLLAKSTSYVAPVVPISQFQQTNSENRLYLGMFKPTTTTFWKGNIKKYGISTINTQTLSVGDIIDAENPAQLVMTSLNTIKDTALSYWSSTADGGDVEKGGIGAVLLASNPDSRNIYTYLGTNTDLTNSSNAFSKSNAAITPTLLGLTSTDTTGKNNVVDFVHGWDAWDWNKNGITNETRDWILGAFIHSRPLVIHYKSQDVIYAGANDGMLHAFDNATGNELWAFIPPKLLPNLKNFNGQPSLQVFVDGSPKAYVTYDSQNNVTQAILIFGERRGGNQYIALDVKNPSAPNFLWEINPSQIIYGTITTPTAAYQELGQTWSTPILGQIKNGTGKQWVAFIGGGYDDVNEDKSPATSDTKGRAVYVVNITNGSQIWKYSYSNNSAMKYCIPSDIATIDVDGNGLIERLYVGDMGGQVWRFDIGDMSNTGSWTGYRVFTGSGKIFYPPDVTFENDRGSGTYDFLFFGAGDREKPNDTTVVNTLYAIKDYDNDTNPPTPLPLTESNLVDVTLDTLQDPNASSSAKTTMLSNLKTQSGWYIRLNQNPGEKSDGIAVVLGGAVYYTTFTPSPSSSVCTLGTGTGSVYILQYQTGNAVFNLDANNDVEGMTVIKREDRSMSIGSGIPTGIIIAIIGDTVMGYGGVAGGVFSPLLPTIRTIVPLNWRIVF